MKSRPYPNYKPSNADWMGEVPSHWDVDRLKWTVDISRNGVWGDEPDGGPEDIACIRVADFDRANQTVILEDPTIRKIRMADQEGRILQKGDLLLEKSGGGDGWPVGFVVEYTHDLSAVCSNFIARMKPSVKVRSRYLRYLHHALYAARVNVRSIKQTSGIQNLDAGSYFDELAPYPPHEEQDAIEAFLDRETAKIDTLVAEQRILIERLREKRRCLIRKIVTNGVQPGFPLVDSGIDWLGQIPKHWAIDKVSRHFKASKGKHGQLLTKEFCANNYGKYPVYSGQTENSGIMATWSEFEFDFNEDGVLFSTTVGANAMHLMHLFGKFSLSQNCMIIWPTSDLCLTRFYYFHFQPLFEFQRGLIPDHMQASFRVEDLYGYRIALPPREEQEKIVEFLGTQTSKIDTLIAEAETSITLLQEHRSALITAVVTGKVDVRGLAEGASA